VFSILVMVVYSLIHMNLFFICVLVILVFSNFLWGVVLCSNWGVFDGFIFLIFYNLPYCGSEKRLSDNGAYLILQYAYSPNKWLQTLQIGQFAFSYRTVFFCFYVDISLSELYVLLYCLVLLSFSFFLVLWFFCYPASFFFDVRKIFFYNIYTILNIFFLVYGGSVSFLHISSLIY